MRAALRHALVLVTILSIKWLAGAGLTDPVVVVAALAPASPLQQIKQARSPSCTRLIPADEQSSRAIHPQQDGARADVPPSRNFSFAARPALLSFAGMPRSHVDKMAASGRDRGGSPLHQIKQNLQSKLHVYDLSAESRARRTSAVEDPARAVAPSLGGTYPVAARRPTSIFAQGPSSAVDEMTSSGLDRGGGGGNGAATGGGGPGADGSRRVCAECVSVWGAPGVGVARSGEVCVGWCAGSVDGGADEQEADDPMCAAAVP